VRRSLEQENPKMSYSSRIALIVGSCLVLALSAMAQTPPAPAKSPSSSDQASGSPGPVPGTYESALLQPAALHAIAPNEYEVKFVTTAGDFTVKVTRAWAPNGADRFYNLVQHHFYDGASFFRVIKGFMAQFGLSPYPPVNVAWVNAHIKDDPVKQNNRRGYVTFAMSSQPNSRSTQVFINLVDNNSLDRSGFAPFGQVIEGMENVDKIYSGYGEGDPNGNGPRQDYVGGRGHTYLEKSFPKLDVIRSARLVQTEASPASAAPSPEK
jgi:peptidyl-prolyl cis-trans isomerase A (cyclophilin A)